VVLATAALEFFARVDLIGFAFRARETGLTVGDFAPPIRLPVVAISVSPIKMDTLD
jgi:hypothetical protein